MPLNTTAVGKAPMFGSKAGADSIKLSEALGGDGINASNIRWTGRNAGRLEWEGSRN